MHHHHHHPLLPRMPSWIGLRIYPIVVLRMMTMRTMTTLFSIFTIPLRLLLLLPLLQTQYPGSSSQILVMDLEQYFTRIIPPLYHNGNNRLPHIIIITDKFHLPTVLQMLVAVVVVEEEQPRQKAIHRSTHTAVPHHYYSMPTHFQAITKFLTSL